MDKISILLQDKEVIAELAKDPEVQIRIKDAIIDGIGKRAVKLMNANAEILGITKRVGDSIAKEIETIMFDNDRYNKRLKEVYTDRIKCLVDGEFDKMIRQQIKERLLDVSKEIDSETLMWRLSIKQKIEKADFETIVREEIDKILSRKLRS